MSLRRAFVVDLNRCTGCHACEIACRIANHVPGDRRWREVHTFNELHVHGVETMHLSLACNHCAAAPCMDQCPARAFSRDKATGAVLLDAARCLGCGYCAWVCPYGAPRFDAENGVMAKCDFCIERQRDGAEPACVTACPTGALTLDDLDEASLMNAAPGFARAGTDPSIRIEPLRPGRLAPRQTERPALPPWRRLSARIKPLITPVHEWPLAVFTLVAAALTGLFLAARAGAPSPRGIPFLAVGCTSLILSAWHLGRRERAWRAGLNIESSWLSREIVIFGGFLGAAGFSLLVPGPGVWLAWPATVLGVAALFTIDRVYRACVIPGSGPLHSAQLLGTGLLLAAVAAGAGWAAVSLAGLKALLYVSRKWARRRAGLSWQPLATVLRPTLLASGLAALQSGRTFEALIAVLLAETIDRVEFYDELEIVAPASLMLEDLAARPGAWRAVGPLE